MTQKIPSPDQALLEILRTEQAVWKAIMELPRPTPALGQRRINPISTSPQWSWQTIAQLTQIVEECDRLMLEHDNADTPELRTALKFSSDEATAQLAMRREWAQVAADVREDLLGSPKTEEALLRTAKDTPTMEERRRIEAADVAVERIAPRLAGRGLRRLFRNRDAIPEARRFQDDSEMHTAWDHAIDLQAEAGATAAKAAVISQVARYVQVVAEVLNPPDRPRLRKRDLVKLNELGQATRKAFRKGKLEATRPDLSITEMQARIASAMQRLYDGDKIAPQNLGRTVLGLADRYGDAYSDAYETQRQNIMISLDRLAQNIIEEPRFHLSLEDARANAKQEAAALAKLIDSLFDLQALSDQYDDLATRVANTLDYNDITKSIDARILTLGLDPELDQKTLCFEADQIFDRAKGGPILRTVDPGLQPEPGSLAAWQTDKNASLNLN